MKKISVLAASVAIALTGCGGSDSNSDAGGNTGNPDIPAPGGAVVITGFDGYFKNAVLFVDSNNNGVWDTTENALGVTDGNGQVELDKKPEGVLALQTVVPNTDMQKRMIAINPEKYAGGYTVDMDHPSQPMAHELVFRAPNSSDVISPITDLVAIEMAKNKSKSEEEAKQAVSEALGGDVEALYTDFVTGKHADAVLHKTAQILTESKAANTSYEDKAMDFAKEADTVVGNMSEEDVKNKDIKPVIKDDNPSGDIFDPVVITNSKLIVDKAIFDKADAGIPSSIKENANFGGVTVSVEGLFTDADLEDAIVPKLQHTLEGTGIVAVLSLDGKMLTLEPANPVMKPGHYTITLTATDVNSENTQVGTSSAVFEVEITANNLAPEVDDAEKVALQAEVDAWYLEQGEVFEQSLSVSNLFSDKDGTIEDHSVTDLKVSGLTAKVENGIVVIAGTPKEQYAAGQTFKVTATDDRGATSDVQFILPEVKEGVTPPPASHPLENQTWYVLEHGSDDGNDNDDLDYSRVWCDSYRFEDGRVYWGGRTIENKDVCSEATILEEGASYRIDNDQFIVTFPSEEKRGETEEYLYTIAQDADYLSKGAKVVLFSDLDQTEGERYSWLSSKSDAEARLKLQSEAGYEDRDFPMYVPASENETYAEGQVSLQMTNFGGQSRVSVFIDTADNETFSCDDLREFYQSFYVSADSIEGHYAFADMQWGCYDEESPQGAAMSIDMPSEFVDGEKYSIIGAVKDSQTKYIEAIKFNMVWTGEGNNE
ncbi:hypothetical protein [Photobacterium sp. DNB22_13_2]